MSKRITTWDEWDELNVRAALWGARLPRPQPSLWPEKAEAERGRGPQATGRSATPSGAGVHGRVMTGMGLVVGSVGLVVGSVWASTHRQDVKAGVRQHRVVERVGTDRWQGGYVILRSWENGSRGRSSTVRVVERSAGWMIPGHRLVEEPDA